LTLILDEPPKVKIQWGDNAEQGDIEGEVVNIGAGFTISKDKLNQDLYFPSFDIPKPILEAQDLAKKDDSGPIILDSMVSLGTLPHAEQKWRLLQRSFFFHRTGQHTNLEAQLQKIWGNESGTEKTFDNALFGFLLRFLAPNGQRWLASLGTVLQGASGVNRDEYLRFFSHYEVDLKAERFDTYFEIFSEYFKGYSEFSQTLLYARQEIPLPVDAVATSTDFEKTRMFYGNAFEVLGAHLDVPAALNNVINGRPFDQMNSMDLRQFRTINKANRTNCFADNAELSWLADEYDSAVRNASHHRWFKLDNSRRVITYRSGGTGAIRRMSYADYLFRCNRMIIRLMMLACLELVLLSTSGKKL